MKLLTSAIAIAASLYGAQAFAWEATEGRPYDGQTVTVLAVKSSQFEAHEARLAEFEEATGIDVIYDYVPFPNMKEALTTEMIAGGDYDVVSVMDQWVVSLQQLLEPIGPGIEVQGTDLSDFPAAHMRHGMLNGELVGRGKQRDINARFKAMASHYVFEPEFCNPAAGWEKGQVEKNVQDARNRMWQVMPVFKDLDELNQWLEDRCIALWAETPHRVLSGTIADAWEAEKPMLMALPPAFDGFVEHSKRVSPTCLITFERNRYSVPASFANRRISLHVYPERLVIVAEGQTVCTHERIIDRSHRRPGRVIYDWRHYLAVIQRKPGALRNGAPFIEMPEAFRNLQGHMHRREGGDREMVDILSLVLHHDENAVLCAVELALEAGVPCVMTQQEPQS